MKKVLLLSFTFIFLLALAGFNPVKADDVVVNGSYELPSVLTQEEYNNLTNTSLLLEFLRQGGVIDTSNVSADYSVTDLISDFGTFFNNVTNGIISFIDPTYPITELRPLDSNVRNNVYKFKGLLPSRMGSDSSNPVPNPDPNYINWINKINYDAPCPPTIPFIDGFWWDNIPNNSIYGYIANNSGNISYCADWEVNNDRSIVLNSSFTSTPTIMGFSPLDINIYSTNNQNEYSFYLSLDSADAISIGTYNGNPVISGSFAYIGGGSYIGSGFYTYGSQFLKSTQSYSYTGNLDSVFNYIANKFRNVNIYVNGEPWSIIGSNENYTLQVYNNTLPDIATNDYGYVHWVYDYEIFYRIDRIWDILEDLLNRPPDPSDPTTTIIQWPDISDVIVDVDGQPAVAVRIYTPDNNIDEEYLSKYGPLIPVFIPLATPVINDTDIFLIASTPMSALPDDLLDVFGYIFIGCLFVCFIHRLLE